MSFSPLVKKLIGALCMLPGVGPKSAQRMAFYLLERNRDGGHYLAKMLDNAMSNIGYCQSCRLLSEEQVCHLCANPNRDKGLICVVESPMDVVAIEQAGGFDGTYFVLSGHLSPIDGIGPQEIGIDQFCLRLEQSEIYEVILATNPTVEGEATAYYLAEMIRARNIIVSRIARGVPLGGELEYIDGSTIVRALADRSQV